MIELVLAIETSTPLGSIAVVEQSGNVLFSESFESNRSHNSMLFAPLQRALGTFSEIDAVIVGTGPGSYTGVRIGISAALGFRFRETFRWRAPHRFAP